MTMTCNSLIFSGIRSMIYTNSIKNVPCFLTITRYLPPLIEQDWIHVNLHLS